MQTFMNLSLLLAVSFLWFSYPIYMILFRIYTVRNYDDDDEFSFKLCTICSKL